MAEYIEREAFMEKFSARSPLLMQIRAYIAAEPAADVVEVVRCGECERRDKGFVSENDTICCPYMEAFMRKDDFCSYGERKDSDTK